MKFKKTLIIAEAGVNHNGDINLAKKLIDVAAAAGADLVKFQTFTAAAQVTQSAKKADYQIKNCVGAESQYEMLNALELTESMHYELIAHCKENEIGFLSTGFDIESVNFLLSLGQQCFKIPSGEITNLPYLRHTAQHAKKIILSTGMSTLGDIEAALEALETAGMVRTNITMLHCTSEYPTPMVDVNLNAMQSLQSAFNVAVGYSDHTDGVEVAIAAVAMGATVIEKHFTLDKDMPGPDHKSSLEPTQLGEMISAIRNIELAMGDGIKRPTPSEIANMQVSRKSIVAKKIIKSGEIFTAENLAVKRPGTGISPMMWDAVIGQRAHRNFTADEIIEL